jgi:hypothetical protein
MSGKMPSDVRRWRAQSLAILTLAGILLAQVCAPLCGNQSCHAQKNDGAAAEPCHGQAAKADAHPFFLGTAKTCGLADLAVALQDEDGQRSLEKQNTAAPRILQADGADLLYLKGLSRIQWRSDGSAGPSGQIFLESTVLRV